MVSFQLGKEIEKDDSPCGVSVAVVRASERGIRRSEVRTEQIVYLWQETGDGRTLEALEQK
mgnify:CR=1 FL=1